MKLFASPERHDIAPAPLMDLIERPVDVGNELTEGVRFELDFVLSPFRNNENALTSDFDSRRCLPEITLAHARSPDSIREEHDSFVITRGLTQFNALRVTQTTPRSPFSIARTG